VDQPKLIEVCNGYHVRALTARECVKFLDLIDQRGDKPQDAITLMAGLCSIGIVDSSNVKVSESPDFWLDQTIDLIQKCGQAVMDNSGMTTDPVGKAEGNSAPVQ